MDFAPPTLLGFLCGLLSAYFLVGGVFALAFFVCGHRVIDPAARGAPVTARLVWLPAAAVLWPLLVMKWVAAFRANR